MAHIVLTHNQDGSFKSVTAHDDNRYGAGDLCAQLFRRGGRAGAGGINTLTKAQLPTLISKVEKFYSQ